MIIKSRSTCSEAHASEVGMAFLEGQQAMRKSLASSVWTDKDEIRAGVYSQLNEPVLPCNTHHRPREGNLQENEVPQFSPKVAERITDQTVKMLELSKTIDNTKLYFSTPTSPRSPRNKDASGVQWRVNEEDAEHRLYLGKDSASPVEVVIVEGVLNGPLEVVLSLVTHFPFYLDWFPKLALPYLQCVEANCTTQLTDAFQTGFLKLKLPWPLPNQEAHCEFFTLYDESTGLATATLTTIPENPKEINIDKHGYSATDAPKLQRGSMRMHATGCFLLQDMGGGRTFIRAFVNMDVKVPASILNTLLQMCGSTIHSCLCREVDNILHQPSLPQRSLFDGSLAGCRMYQRVLAGVQLRNKLMAAAAQELKDREAAEEEEVFSKMASAVQAAVQQHMELSGHGVRGAEEEEGDSELCIPASCPAGIVSPGMDGSLQRKQAELPAVRTAAVPRVTSSSPPDSGFITGSAPLPLPASLKQRDPKMFHAVSTLDRAILILRQHSQEVAGQACSATVHAQAARGRKQRALSLVKRGLSRSFGVFKKAGSTAADVTTPTKGGSRQATVDVGRPPKPNTFVRWKGLFHSQAHGSGRKTITASPMVSGNSSTSSTNSTIGMVTTSSATTSPLSAESPAGWPLRPALRKEPVTPKQLFAAPATSVTRVANH